MFTISAFTGTLIHNYCTSNVQKKKFIRNFCFMNMMLHIFFLYTIDLLQISIHICAQTMALPINNVSFNVMLFCWFLLKLSVHHFV